MFENNAGFAGISSCKTNHNTAIKQASKLTKKGADQSHKIKLV